MTASRTGPEGSDPTCRPWQGGYRESEDAARKGNEEGRIMRASSVPADGGFFLSNPEFPISSLISSRCKKLNLRPVELIRRCGYRNVAKGLRRLQCLSQGHFEGTQGLIRGLPVGLEVPAEVVQEAIAETKRVIFEAGEAAWRVSFRPHAVIMCERERPTQIFVAAILGVSNLRRVEFDLSQGPLSFVHQALDGLRKKLDGGRRDYIPTFGRPKTIIINYTHDHAVRFTLQGKPVEVLDRAYRLGQATFHLKGRVVTPEEWRAVGGEFEIIETK
jgi:hypothetical protein